jgi:hypothetical protein
MDDSAHLGRWRDADAVADREPCRDRDGAEARVDAERGLALRDAVDTAKRTAWMRTERR